MTDDDTEDAVEYVTPSKAYLRRRLQQMDPYDLETFVADVWTQLGWSTRVVGSPEVQQYASLRLQEDAVDTVTIVTTGEFSRQAADMAPDLDVTLVDGEDLLGVLDELEGYDVFVDHFDDIQVGTPDGDAGEDESDDAGILARLRSWFGFFVST